jgi:hypothetical protein
MGVSLGDLAMDWQGKTYGVGCGQKAHVWGHPQPGFDLRYRRWAGYTQDRPGYPSTGLPNDWAAQRGLRARSVYPRDQTSFSV